MEHMTDAEWRAFATTGTRTGKFAVQRSNGRPHVTPVWFILEGAEPGSEPDPDSGEVRVVLNTGHDSVKGKALRRDPHFALCVDDQQPPYSFVLFECTAEIIEDLDQLKTSSIKIAARYMGEDRAEEFGTRNAVPGEYLVRGRIDRVTAFASMTE